MDEDLRRIDGRRGLEIVQRLVSDSRMKTVWSELYKRSRVDGSYFYPASRARLCKAAVKRHET